ncbi:MAG TPA: class I SAM-dependent methyltransferase [Acidimicrobiia bacterium]|nr:class I SAM-dependent methyltransferase [Acidimicrobiia bacterium]
MKPEPDTTVETVKEFWESHVNNEYYTNEQRASDAYFRDIEDRRYRAHYNLRELFASLAGSKGRLLEIGCGIGVDSIQLAKCGFDVTAVDLTESALAVAKEFAAHRDVAVDFRLGNAERLDFSDGEFDVVYSFGVLHHTPDIEKAVSEVRRVLRPGGTAYVMLYHKYSLVNLVHRVFRLPYESPRDRDDHCPVVYTFSKRSARELFGEFSDVSIHAAYPFTYGFGPLTMKTPIWLLRPLGRAMGWHLMITAVR